MDLKNVMELQGEFDKHHVSSQPFFVPISSSNIADLEHLVVCLVGELGEFSNELKKAVRGDCTYEDARPRLEEELVDVFIYLMKIAGQAGFDLEKGYLAKLEKNKLRFLHWKVD